MSPGFAEPSGWRRRARATLVALAYVTASVGVGIEWLGLDLHLRVRHRGVMVVHEATVPALVYGTAAKPFVLRTLVPSTVRLIREAIPEPTARRWWLKILRRWPGLSQALPELEWEQEFLLEYLIAVAVMQACLVGFLFGLRALYRELYGRAAWPADVVPLVAAATLPFFFRVGAHFLYDFATLLFVTLGLLLMERRRWALYYPVFAVALLNKETLALLTLVFAVRYFRSMPRATWTAHLVAQTAIVAAVRAWLLFVFRFNPRGAFRWFWDRNLAAMGERGVEVPTAVLFGVLLLAVILRWRREAPLMKAALVMVPPLAIAYLVFGIYGEIRLFYEIVPPGVLWAFNAALQLAGAPVAPRAPSTA
jgi:hypothetical protein